MKKILKVQFLRNGICSIYIPKCIVEELNILKGEYLSIETMSKDSVIIKKVKL